VKSVFYSGHYEGTFSILWVQSKGNSADCSSDRYYPFDCQCYNNKRTTTTGTAATIDQPTYYINSDSERNNSYNEII
jgi:hypothetical protein